MERLEKFHRAITFNDFQVFLSGEVWTLGTRVAFCASAQPGGQPNDCNAKHGMQAADFWNYFGVDFEKSEFYSPLSLWPPSDPKTKIQNQTQASLSTSDSDNASAPSALDSWALEWRKRFPPRKYPVIALAEPLVVRREDLWMHRYMQWSPEQDEKVATIAHNYFRVPFLAIHLRNHASQRDACARIHSEKLAQLGASYQCLGLFFVSSFFVLCSVYFARPVSSTRGTRRHSLSLEVFDNYSVCLVLVLKCSLNYSCSAFALQAPRANTDCSPTRCATRLLAQCAHTSSASSTRTAPRCPPASTSPPTTTRCSSS